MSWAGNTSGLARGFAFAVSAVLHGGAAAALIGLSSPDPPAPLPMIAIEIVAEMPPGAGGKAAAKGARTPRAGARRTRRAQPSKPAKAQTPPKAQAPPELEAKPPVPARRSSSEAAVRPPRPAKPRVSMRALRSAARSAHLKRRHKVRSKRQPARVRKAVSGKAAPTSIATYSASAYRPPRPGGGSAGNPLPKYPPAARRRGAEGRVVLAVQVGADGRARSIELRQSSGHADLDAAALAAVRRWRFAPASRGGVSVEGLAVVPIRFRLVAR